MHAKTKRIEAIAFIIFDESKNFSMRAFHLALLMTDDSI